MQELLKKHLENYLYLNQAEISEGEKYFKVNLIPKGNFLVLPNSNVNHVYFMVKGCCRFFHKKNNQSITHWFEFEDSIFTSLRSFTSGGLSGEYVQMLEDGQLLSIHKDDLLRLYDEFHQWDRLGRLVVEDYSRRMLDRITTFQTLTATQRYLMLMEKEPRIIQRIPLGYISSYLGISQETLSRIRSQIRTK
jgi:CRP-like cAMP-binding protein